MENPELKAAIQHRRDAYRTIKSYPPEARRYDLRKLGWVRFDEQPYDVYNAQGFRQCPSDYFPRWRSESEKRAAYRKSGAFYDLFMEIERLQEAGLLPE